MRIRPKDDPAINQTHSGIKRMERGLLAQLSPHERTTLRRVANGDVRSGALNPFHVTQLLSLALIEEKASVYYLTVLGQQRIDQLERR